MDKPQKTEKQQLIFFAQCYMKFTEAARISGELKFSFEIAGKRICLLFAGKQLYSALIPAFKPLKTDDSHPPDLTICIWDNDSSGIEMPEAPCDPYCFTHRGDLKGFNSSRIKTAYKWSENSLSVIDLFANTAVFQVNSHKKLPLSIVSAPFHTLLQCWFEKQGWQLFPGSAIVSNDAALFIPGKKVIETDFITTSGLKLNNNIQFIGYNYFIIHIKPELSITKLYSDSHNNIVDRPVKTPLKAILIPELHSETSSTIENISRVQALRLISFDLMTQIPYSGWKTHQFIRELIHKAHPFKVNFGTDKVQTINILSDHISNTQKYSHHSKRDYHPKPLISLIIPVFNGERFIRETIDHVLFQKYPHLEIIVVNDGSTDGTEAIIHSFHEKVRYLKQPNAGPSSARNNGIEAVKGEFIAFLDADDFYPENNLQQLAEVMMQNPDSEVVHGYAQLLQADPTSGKFECYGNPKETYPYYICAGLYRKSVFEKVGFFDTTLRFSEDTDWFLRAIELNCKIKRVEEVTLFVRRHEGNMTKFKDLNELMLPLVLKKRIERKKKCLK
jgi:GT2 family glycosyltransferase